MTLKVISAAVNYFQYNIIYHRWLGNTCMWHLSPRSD